MGFREEDKIRRVLVQHRDDVNQRGAVGPRFLNVYDQKFEGYGRRVGGCRVANSGPVR